MKSIRVTGLLFACSAMLILAGCAEFFAAPPGETGPSQFLFVMTGGSGTIAPDPHAGTPADDVHFVVTLNELSPVATYFLDYPLGISAAINSELLVEAVEFSRNNPPTGAIVLSDPTSADRDVIIGALASAEFDEASNSVRFHIHIEGKDHVHVDDGSVDPFHHLDHRKDGMLPNRFGGFAAFIDADSCDPKVCKL